MVFQFRKKVEKKNCPKNHNEYLSGWRLLKIGVLPAVRSMRRGAGSEKVTSPPSFENKFRSKVWNRVKGEKWNSHLIFNFQEVALIHYRRRGRLEHWEKRLKCFQFPPFLRGSLKNDTLLTSHIVCRTLWRSAPKPTDPEGICLLSRIASIKLEDKLGGFLTRDRKRFLPRYHLNLEWNDFRCYIN